MLRPVGSWDVREADRVRPIGGIAVDVFGPSGNLTHFVPSAAVSATFGMPSTLPEAGMGSGRSRLRRRPAGSTAETTLALADEAGRPRGSFLTLPDPSKAETISASVKAARGAVLGVEGGDWNVEQGGQNRAEFIERRFGADPPAGLVAIHAAAFDQVVAACGLTGLFTAGADSARRESYRQALHSVIAPLGKHRRCRADREDGPADPARLARAEGRRHQRPGACVSV